MTKVFFAALQVLLLSLISTLTEVYGFYSAGDKVVTLDSGTFKSKVLNDKDSMWMVEFYAPWCGHCQSLTPEWKKMAKAVSGVIKVGAVDLDAQTDRSPFPQVEGFPTIYFYGVDKKNPEKYQLGRDAKSMVSFVKQQLTKALDKGLNGGTSSNTKKKTSSSGGSGGNAVGQVIHATDDDFTDLVLKSSDLFFVEFYAPWCGHCKSLEPKWKEAAQTASKQGCDVKFVAVDATVSPKIAQKYQIQGYPTIKLFGPNKKKPEEYQGAREAADLVSAAVAFADKHSKAPEIVELVDSGMLDSTCGQGKSTKPIICFITILPDILDTGATGRNDLLKKLASVSEENKGLPVRYLWTSVGAQPDLEKTFDLGGSGYPASVAISLSKNMYVKYTRAFDLKKIGSFLSGLMLGKEGVSPMSSVPKIVTVPKWDGKDGQVPNDEL